MTDRDERLHAEIRGDPQAGPPVVLLHGFGGSADAWAPIAGRVGLERAAIAYDLPGHHRSLRAGGIGGAGRMARAILVDLSARGVARFHLVGHSMGGAVAALMALRENAMVASLTLLAPGGFGPQINIRLLERFAQATDEQEMRVVCEAMFGWGNRPPTGYVSGLVERRRVPGAVEALQAILPTMTTGEGEERVQGTIPRGDLAALAMPIKVVWGGLDCVLPPSHAAGLPAMIALHVFARAGHMLIEEEREGVTRLVLQNIRAAG